MTQVADQVRVLDATPAGTVDHRRWPRTECAHDLVIQPVRQGVPGEALMTRSEDFSTMGLGLIHAAAMSKGEQFLVPLKTQAGPPLPLLYSVVHCRPVGDGLYHIGAELVSVFNLDQAVKAHRGATVAACIAQGVAGKINRAQ